MKSSNCRAAKRDPPVVLVQEKNRKQKKDFNANALKSFFVCPWCSLPFSVEVLIASQELRI